MEDWEGRRDLIAEFLTSDVAALDQKCLAAARACFQAEEGGELVPKPYAAANAVRYLALELGGQGGGAALQEAARRACKEVVAAFPPGVQVYSNPHETFHVTVFHTGRPGEERQVDQDGVQGEVEACRGLVSSVPVVEVEVQGVALSPTGVLLFLMAAPGGGESPIDLLRARCRAAFPSAPKKQATYIMHTSLARVVAGDPTSEELAAVVAKCREVSEGVRGMRAALGNVWFVEEAREMACWWAGGRKIDLPLGRG